MTNISAQSGKVSTLNCTLPVMESFYSIQGEGFHSGKAAHFIRLAGCDVGCHWCDVKESWDEKVHPRLNIKDIVDEANKSSGEIVIITGGEPLMHNLSELTFSLKEMGKKTHIETSGAHPISGSWDWVCLSPKKFKKPLDEIFPFVDELKIVVYNRSDFAWAEEYAKRVSENCKLYLQPEWSRSETMMPFITEYVKSNPHWEISLQIHKFMDIP